ncbi:MAG: hypothetical protein C0619_11210 [Desulfuromonas sp.]|nr:MAG: hypothetical protein C0619_11210 [Desulfuromonas sp.]
MSIADKKHPCPDCSHCQWCSDDRCRLCLRTDCCKKLSIADQIELYDKLNNESGQRAEDLRQRDRSS